VILLSLVGTHSFFLTLWGWGAGIDTANIVESSGARPRRSGSSLNSEKRKEDSDDDESLLSAPLERKDGYNLADSDSD
jgi:hypothetical protein